jgi:hypothetical protein
VVTARAGKIEDSKSVDVLIVLPQPTNAGSVKTEDHCQREVWQVQEMLLVHSYRLMPKETLQIDVVFGNRPWECTVDVITLLLQVSVKSAERGTK